MIVFRHADPRLPFLWEGAGQPSGRWHEAGRGPAHYLADTPEGAWAEFLRHEEITDPADLAGIRRALWAIEIPELPSARPRLTDRTLRGGTATYARCSREAERLRRDGASGLVAPSAALEADGARGNRVDGGLKRGPAREPKVIVLFGRRPDLVGWAVVDEGHPPGEVLAHVRHLSGPSLSSLGRRATAGLLVLGLALAACTGSGPVAGPSESPTPTASSSPTPPVLAPLTGLEVASAAVLKRPALAVKIDNHTGARPQVGLERADIVYEEPVEGGITRFIAIFHSKDASKVGPVRSARLTDLDVLAEYGRPLLAFSGAAGYVLRAIRKANLVSLPHGANGSIYRRDSSRWSAPHNLFSSTKDLWRIGARRNPTPAPELFGFGALLPPPTVAEPTSSPSATASPTPPAWPKGRKATIPFGGAWTAVWRYDGASGTYLRWHGSVAHLAVTGTQISAANVIVMRVATQRGNSDAAEHGTPELKLVGSGEAVLLRNGVRIAGRWSRPSLGRPTTFTDSLGRALVLAPGNTWIELVPTRIVPRYR